MFTTEFAEIDFLGAIEGRLSDVEAAKEGVKMETVGGAKAESPKFRKGVGNYFE